MAPLKRKSQRLLSPPKSKKQGLVKLAMKSTTKKEEKTIRMDRISQLPLPIQHHILSFLSKTRVARISLVSKTWRSIAHSLPIVDIGPSYILPRHKSLANLDHGELLTLESILSDQIEESIQRFTALSSTLQKFHLQIDSYHPQRWDTKLDRWMQDVVTKLRPEDLSLGLAMRKQEQGDEELGLLQNYYPLHPHVLCSKTITRLRLAGCELTDCGAMTLPNLLGLRIERIILNQKMIDNFIAGCQSVETLELLECDGLSSICVSGLARLDRVLFMECVNLTRVKIVAPMLRFFSFWVNSRISMTRYTHIDLSGCESTLKMLMLACTNMTKEVFKSFVSKFPQLEELILLDILYMESMEIPNKKIRQLQIYGCKQLEKVEIGAPHHLRVLQYNYNKLPFYPLDSKSFLNHEIDFQARFGARTESANLFSSWAQSFRDFFLEFNQFKDIKLIVQYTIGHATYAIVWEEVDESFIEMLNYMKDKQDAQIRIMCGRGTRCEFYFLWGRQTIISLISRNSQSIIDLLKVLNEKMEVKDNDKSNCCNCVHYHICWKRGLDSVEMINGEEIEFEMSNVFGSSQITKFLDLFKSYDTAKYDIRHIKLHWNVK